MRERGLTKVADVLVLLSAAMGLHWAATGSPVSGLVGAALFGLVGGYFPRGRMYESETDTNRDLPRLSTRPAPGHPVRAVATHITQGLFWGAWPALIVVHIIYEASENFWPFLIVAVLSGALLGRLGACLKSFFADQGRSPHPPQGA